MIELEFEVVHSNKKSFFLRSSHAFDIEKSIISYRYFGGGMKYYIFSQGLYFERRNNNEVFTSFPKWRFYLGWDVGISHVVLQTIGEILRITTSIYDYGLTSGVIFNTSDKLGIEFNLTTQLSTGFTSVTTGVAVIKVVTGISYFL